jgi:hypothetical protein
LKNPTLRESHIAVLQREGTYLQVPFPPVSKLPLNFTSCSADHRVVFAAMCCTYKD